MEGWNKNKYDPTTCFYERLILDPKIHTNRLKMNKRKEVFHANSRQKCGCTIIGQNRLNQKWWQNTKKDIINWYWLEQPDGG